MNPAVDFYIEGLAPELSILAQQLRMLILDFHPSIDEKIAYGIPFFFSSQNICYLRKEKTGIDISFIRGSQFKDQSQLEARGRASVRSLHYELTDKVDHAVIYTYLQESIELLHS